MATSYVYPQGRYYGALAGNVQFHKGDYYLYAADNTNTALAAGGQTGAFNVVSQITRISTVATAGDSVQLPLAAEGLKITLINSGANAMQVFANIAGSDTINGVAGSTGISQMAGSVVEYVCSQVGGGAWYAMGIGEGYSSGLPTIAYATIAANSGAAQSGATPITTPLVFVTSAGSAYSVLLPVSAPGMSIQVNTVSGSAHTVAVFPNAGGTTTETINALSANAGITMANLTSATFSCSAAGSWFTNPRVPS